MNRLINHVPSKTHGLTDAIKNAPLTSVEPYVRGYKNRPHLKGFIASSHRTNAAVSSAAAVIDQVVIIGLILATSALAAYAERNPAAIVLTVFVCTVTVCVLARQFRSLENLVHDASHYNWNRRKRWLNDFLGYMLAAIPVGARLSHYRKSHLRHHGRFGTDEDPDLDRYIELNMEYMDKSSAYEFGKSILSRLPVYQRGWLRSVRATPATSIAPVAWFTVTVSVPSWWFFGPVAGVVATVEWLVTLLIALPMLRFIAESGEHIYTGTNTVFDATVSNVGLLHRILVHTHNDGYHTVHHLWPGIPHYRVHRVHRYLLRHDPEGYAHRLRYRMRVLQNPRIGIRNR